MKVSEENLYLKKCLEKFTGSEMFWQGGEEEEEAKEEMEVETSV